MEKFMTCQYTHSRLKINFPSCNNEWLVTNSIKIEWVDINTKCDRSNAESDSFLWVSAI